MPGVDHKEAWRQEALQNDSIDSLSMSLFSDWNSWPVYAPQSRKHYRSFVSEFVDFVFRSLLVGWKSNRCVSQWWSLFSKPVKGQEMDVHHTIGMQAIVTHMWLMCVCGYNVCISDIRYLQHCLLARCHFNLNHRTSVADLWSAAYCIFRCDLKPLAAPTVCGVWE